MKIIALATLTLALLVAAPAAEASCHECVDETIELAACLGDGEDADGCASDCQGPTHHLPGDP